ncbi:MAG: hypothetical protein L6Q95_09975 [Planctomycetes bacterium]|nr:hypothetical protein [Planctomycetota bacterium]
MRNALLGLITIGLGIAAAQDARETKPYVTLAGAASKVAAKEYDRITTRDELVKVWLRHVGSDPAGHDDFYNEAGVPDVDFGRCMVVAVFGGQCVNSAGIYAVSVAEEADRVLLRFGHRSFQSGPEGDRATPFGFFFVPRSSKALVLEENVQNLIGGDPKWKERARFDALAK